jgi:hypothetical protein
MQLRKEMKLKEWLEQRDNYMKFKNKLNIYFFFFYRNKI